MNGVPPVDFEPALELFRSVRNPQSIDSSDENGGYWDNIFSLIMEGRLVDVWQIVSLHGDVAAAIGNGEVINSNVKGLESDKRLVQAIHNVLHTHPYVHLIGLDGGESLPTTIPLEFKEWQEKVSHILNSQSQFLGRISELNTLLLMLLGDKDTLIRHSFGEWTTLGTSLLLYMYPPPLIRANISKILERAMEMASPKDFSSEEERIK
jgi:hypothetical protein